MMGFTYDTLVYEEDEHTTDFDRKILKYEGQRELAKQSRKKENKEEIKAEEEEKKE